MEFSPDFRETLAQLFAWRRDVRRFRTDPVAEDEIAYLLDQCGTAPSVGLSEPWRFVIVNDPTKRARVRANFEAENARALEGYEGERQKIYASLKLAGLGEAPVQIAAFCDETDGKGEGLGAQTMPEMRRYSVVCAVMQLWLSARAEGLGLGWISILDPARLTRDLGIDPDWRLIAYLCLGYPQEEHLDCELERAGWETREGTRARVVTI